MPAIKMFLEVLASVLGIVLAVFVWLKFPGAILSMLDFNLSLIKWACGFIVAPYGAMIETALRAGLGADKALLFLEGTLAVKGFFLLLRLIFSSPKKKS
ncbi:hypothetical protein HY629_00135 [Candidatus Uhrbacteria bacterium]|nr:hypothetical protein [Candidatus Uhrbacteria bacterium]